MSVMTELLAQNGDTVTLTTGGLVVMTFSCALVLGLLIFCLVKIFAEKSPETHHHAPLDIETKDQD